MSEIFEKLKFSGKDAFFLTGQNSHYSTTAHFKLTMKYLANYINTKYFGAEGTDKLTNTHK